MKLQVLKSSTEETPLEQSAASAAHIACDVASQSEIVIPLIKNGGVIGVLDIDAPVTGRFDAEDRKGLEHLAKLWLDASDI